MGTLIESRTVSNERPTLSDQDSNESQMRSMTMIENKEMESLIPITPADITFESLGLIEPLVQACYSLGYKKPSPIQAQAIPYALQQRDLIGLAQTGSGKTAAFALPILQDLLDKQQKMFACVLVPTRELAVQISEQFQALGANIGVQCVVIVGGLNIVEQAIALAKRPHIIIATPGRLVDHLENTKGFHLKTIRYLVSSDSCFFFGGEGRRGNSLDSRRLR